MRNTFKRWYDTLCVELRPSRSRPRAAAYFRPQVLQLEERVVPVTDTWIAKGAMADWSVGTNWSLGVSPVAGQDVLFKIDPGTGAGDSGCYLSVTTPTLASLTFDPTWNDVLNLVAGSGDNGVINTHNLTLNARTSTLLPTYEIGLSTNSKVHCDQDVEFKGGSIGGSGTLQVEGVLNIGGTTAADKPTLGCLLNLGDGTVRTTMAYSSNTVALVVKDGGNITVNTNATLDFDGCDTATAISNGDTNTHTITIAGGTVNRTDNAEMFVAMGVTINSGDLFVYAGGSGGGPIHFTTSSAGPGNGGLIVNGGAFDVYGSMIVEQGVYVDGGVSFVETSGTLTSGQNGAPRVVNVGGGTVYLEGQVVAHGGIDMAGGTVSTRGSVTSMVTMDAGDTFGMDGGALDVTTTSGAVGKLEIAGGNMYIEAGTVVDNCDSGTGAFGQLIVDKNLTISGNAATFDCSDEAMVGVVGFAFPAITVKGTLSGDFYFYDLPTESSHSWAAGVLTITLYQ